MNYNGISVCFACRLCETSFDQVGDFIEHKKTYHFQDFQKIKCIVFDERILSDSSQGYGFVSPSSRAGIVIKTENPADPNTDTNVDYENSYFKHEIEPELGNFIFEPKIEVVTFEEEISKNPIVLLKRLSAKKIWLLTSRNRSIAQPHLAGQDDPNFIFHSHHHNTISERNNEPVPTPVFEIVCKQENTTSPNCTETATLTNHMEHHQDCVPQSYSAKTVAPEWNRDNKATNNITDENVILRPFKCPEPNCPKRFRYEESVSHHFASHSGLKPFKCPELNCRKTFTYKFALKVHSNIHTDKSVFSRGHQPKIRKELNPERNFEIVTSKRFKCPEPNCESSFSSKSYLQSHLHSHSDSKRFNYPVPAFKEKPKEEAEVFQTRGDEEEEEEEEENNDEEDQELQDEEKVYESGATGAEEKKWKRKMEGPKCSTTTTENVAAVQQYDGNTKSPDELGTGAVVEKKKRQYQYQCTLCPRIFRSTGHVKDHMRSHSREKPFECEKCGTNYMSRKGLMGHLNKKHPELVPDLEIFKCSQCSKTFVRKDLHKKHLRTHSAERFSCLLCSKLLKSLELLEQHMMRHKNERRFECPHEKCKKFFTTCSERSSHVKLIHRKIKRLVKTVPKPL